MRRLLFTRQRRELDPLAVPAVTVSIFAQNNFRWVVMVPRTTNKTGTIGDNYRTGSGVLRIEGKCFAPNLSSRYVTFPRIFW